MNVLGRSVACNAYHSIVERLARWLLLTQDRIQRDEVLLTHEMLSQMLAATRPRVSLAATKLRKLEIIDYRRGLFRILDRKRLERTACECYEATKAHQKMLPLAAGRSVRYVGARRRVRLIGTLFLANQQLARPKRGFAARRRRRWPCSLDQAE